MKKTNHPFFENEFYGFKSEFDFEFYNFMKSIDYVKSPAPLYAHDLSRNKDDVQRIECLMQQIKCGKEDPMHGILNIISILRNYEGTYCQGMITMAHNCLALLNISSNDCRRVSLQ